MENKSSNKHETDRIRLNTSADVNKRIDKSIDDNIRFYATQSKERITQRIEELDKLWDVDRIIQGGAAGTSLFTLLLGAIGSKKWWLLTATSLGFLGNHAINGWSPSMYALRSMGCRTRQEIEREKYALKALRGDFDNEEFKNSTSIDERIKAAIEVTKK
ncbi:MAG: hypothetical protein K9I29_08765 [Bacteroidales bacterium]|mgnify:CR=1 FL=1|nr:hypothetical protein [Bacteroidales bacterium]MCF8328370.1 hypothetical protein [Bacteroidales bacterium]